MMINRIKALIDTILDKKEETALVDKKSKNLHLNKKPLNRQKELNSFSAYTYLKINDTTL